MITRNHRNALLLTVLFIVCSAWPVLAADPNKLITEEEISLDLIKSLFTDAYMDAEIDADGDLKLQEGGTKIFIKLNKEQKLITMFSPWALKASVSDLKKLEFVNRLNDDLIFVRFAMVNPTRLWCDYQYLYDGGITPKQIINNYRLFVRVVKHAVHEKDPDDIVGRD